MLGPVAAIAAGIALVVAVVKNWGAIMEWGKGIIGAAVDAVGEKIAQLKEWFAGVWAAIQDAAGGVEDAVGGAIGAVITTVEDVFTTVRDTVVGAWDAVIDAVSTAWETIKNVVQVGVCSSVHPGRCVPDHHAALALPLGQLRGDHPGYLGGHQDHGGQCHPGGGRTPSAR